MRCKVRGTSILVLLSSLGAAQPATTQHFEVASVRPNRSGTRGSSLEFSSGGERFAATNVPFGPLVLVAYDITVRQLSGPAEFLSEKYDVAAKAEHPAKPSELLHMLQSLLTDRFKLVVRREVKNVPVYALIIGKGGPKLRTSNVSDDGRVIARTPSLRGGAEPRSGQLIFKNESMSDFAWALSGRLELAIV